jgi:CheY-like chemotaxis protein
MAEKKTVHLADDDDDDRQLMKEAFEEANPDVTVVESENGKELIDNMKKSDDLSETVAVVDMNMPRMNGLEAVAAIKADPTLADVPTVMLSTSDNPDLIRKAMEVGVDDFITKPNSFKDLRDIAIRIFKRFFSGIS